jgi:hypothetical protein
MGTTYVLVGTGSLIFVASLIAILVGIFIAAKKTKIDNIQERAAEMAGVLEHRLGLKGMADFFQKFAVGNFLGAKELIVSLWQQYGTEDKIDDLIVRIISKAFPNLAKDPEHKVKMAMLTASVIGFQLDDPETEKILEPIIASRIMGQDLTSEARANLAVLSTSLDKWGLDGLAKVAMSLSSEQFDAAKAQIHALVVELSTPDGQRSAAKRVLRELVPEFMSTPEGAAYLRQLVDAVPQAPAPAAK